MDLGAGGISVIGDHSQEVEREGSRDACLDLRRVAVEESGWTVGSDRVTGEEVSREEKFAALRVESAMSHGVTGEVDDGEALPNIDEVPIVEISVRGEGSKA